MLIEYKLKFEKDCLLITQKITQGPNAQTKPNAPVLQRGLSDSFSATVAAFASIPQAAASAAAPDPGGAPPSEDRGDGPPTGSGSTTIFGPFIFLRGTSTCGCETKASEVEDAD